MINKSTLPLLRSSEFVDNKGHSEPDTESLQRKEEFANQIHRKRYNWGQD